MADVLAVQYDDYGGPEVLKLRPVTPPQPGPGEVLIEVRAASMNPIDWKVRSGAMQKFLPQTFPATTGRDGAGKVIAAGADVDRSLVGARVCFMAPRGVGAWSQQVAMPTNCIAKVPDNVADEQAAALPLAGASAWAGIVQTANVGPGMRVLIHAAAGGVGSLAVQIARERGAHVIATCSVRNVDFVRSLGAEQVIAYDRTAFEQEVRDVDVVFDIVGGDVHRRSYQVLRPGGVMAMLSSAPIVDEGAAHGVEVKMARVLPDLAVLEALVALAAAGKLKIEIEHRLPLKEFAKAHEISARGHARGKIVLMMR